MDTLLTLPEAANFAQVDLSYLCHLVDSGTIRASMLSTGARVVSKNDLKTLLPREQREEYKRHAHLAGQGISMRQASDDYDIPHQTISRWVRKGYIRVVGTEGRAVMIDAADMAYCADIYNANPGQGKRIFTQFGAPYIKKS